MQTIGERLEEARKRKGISIREASEATKIRSDYLQKFESNTFELNLPFIYVRGFLRTYGHYLKLNTEKLLTDFTALGLHPRRDARRQDTREVFGRIDLPEPSKAPVPDEPPAREPSTGAALARSVAPARPVPVLPAPTGNSRTKIIAISSGSLVALAVLFFTVRALFAPPTGPDRASVPATTAPSPTAQLGEPMTLIALDNVHLTVTQVSDNSILFDGDLVRGDRRSISKQGKVSIVYNPGRNLQVEVRGKLFQMGLPGYGRSTLD